MTISFKYGNLEKYGARRNLVLYHVRSIVHDSYYMTVVYLYGNIERYILDDITDLRIERNNKK